LPDIRDYSGCWEAAVLGNSADTLAIGALKIVQTGTSLGGTQDVDTSFARSLTGFVRDDGTAFLQKANGNTWFKGVLDKQGQLLGSVNNYPDGLVGSLVGNRVACPPPAD
jgi:hypothetical protein